MSRRWEASTETLPYIFPPRSLCSGGMYMPYSTQVEDPEGMEPSRYLTLILPVPAAQLQMEQE